ncbi:hypothetical protein ACUXJP_001878 [Staphylococcus cohnii]
MIIVPEIGEKIVVRSLDCKWEISVFKLISSAEVDLLVLMSCANNFCF